MKRREDFGANDGGPPIKCYSKVLLYCTSTTSDFGGTQAAARSFVSQREPASERGEFSPFGGNLERVERREAFFPPVFFAPPDPDRARVYLYVCLCVCGWVEQKPYQTVVGAFGASLFEQILTQPRQRLTILELIVHT